MLRGIFEVILAVLLVLVLFLSNPSESDFVSGYLLSQASGQPSASGRSIVIQPLRPEGDGNPVTDSITDRSLNDLARDAQDTARGVADDFVSRVEGANSDFVRGIAANVLPNVLQGQAPVERRNFVIASIFTVPRVGKDILVLGIADRFITLSD